MLLELFLISAGVIYIAVKSVGHSAQVTASKQYIARHGFDQERQAELERMLNSADPEERKQFRRLLGRTVKRDGGWDYRLAVRQISLREGWRYYYLDELYSDPAFVKMNGWKWDECRTPGKYAMSDLIGEARAKELNLETERRKLWSDRCPHGGEVDLFPMDFSTEEDYQKAVAIRYRNLADKIT